MQNFYSIYIESIRKLALTQNKADQSLLCKPIKIVIKHTTLYM